MTRASPHQIGTFAQVAKDRSFTKAAEQLGVSQSSVTQQISKLERVIGAPLFIRRREGLELTVAGRELDQMARRYALLGDAIQSRITNYQKLNQGHLKIIATTPRPVLPIIQRFKARYPAISIDLSLHNRTACRELMKNREADIGVIIEPDLGDDFMCTECRKTKYAATMATDHKLANRNQLELRELADELIVMLEDSSFTEQLVNRKLAERQLRLTQVMKVRTFPLVKETILHGLGISFFLEDSVFPSTSLTTIPVQELDETYTDYLVVPREREGSHLIREFTKFVTH